MNADSFSIYNSFPELNGLQRYYKLSCNAFKSLNYCLFLSVFSLLKLGSRIFEPCKIDKVRFFVSI